MIVLWWIGNALLLFVVLPVVLILLNRVLTPVQRIRKTVDEILEGGLELAGQLEPVPAMLAETDETVKQIADGAVRYAGSVAKLLPAK
jgi:hypothetical protein